MALYKRTYFVVITLLLLGSLIVLWKMTSSGYHFAMMIVITYFSVWGLVIIFPLGPKIKKVIPFILINLSFIIIVVLFESLAMINVVDYRRVFSTPITDPMRNPNYEHDSKLIFKHKPDSHIKGEFKGGNLNHMFHVPEPHVYRYDVKIDSNGFRNDADLKSADIVVLGDSFIEGAEVSKNDLMTSRLSVLQGKSVSNLGTIHYGPQQELIVLKRYALPLKPEIIVWAFYEGNDLRNIYDYKESIKELATNSEKPHSFRERSFIKNSLLAVYRVFGNFKPSAMKRSGVIKKSGGGEELIYFLFAGNPLSDKDIRALDETSSILSEAFEFTSKKGIKLMVIFIPTKFRVYNELLDYEEESECSHWVVNDLPVRLRKKLLEISNEIGFVDLTPKLVESAKAGESPYFIDDSHWSPKGHQVAAQAVDEYISKEAEESAKIERLF